MSIEQTNQLILLILNSVLMSLLSAILLGGTWLRQNTLSQQLHQVRVRYRHITNYYSASYYSASYPAGHSTTYAIGTATIEGSQNPPPPDNQAKIKADLKKVRDRRQQLSNQYQWSHLAMLTLNGVLMLFGVSLFTLALRSLLAFDSLVSTALLLFTLGAGGLLIGIGCILIDLAQGNSGGDSIGHSLGKAMRWLAHCWQARHSRPRWEKQPALLMPIKSPTEMPGPVASQLRKSGR